METKLCRICGKLGENFINIFRSEGLKNKIETCLPIVISAVSLLPDTICGECSENVDNFYSFIKNCLQNIIILEAQYDIHESCLKTKRKHDKSCWTDTTHLKQSKEAQTDDYLELFLKDHPHIFDASAIFDPATGRNRKLVDYEVESDANSDAEEPAASVIPHFGRKYFSDAENDLISEISQRKKRKLSFSSGVPAKRGRMEPASSRRKNRQPKKLEAVRGANGCEEKAEFLLPQVCLLCEEQFSGAAYLAAHVFDTHGIDMAGIVAMAATQEGDLRHDGGLGQQQKKKLPNLLKISDLKQQFEENQATEAPESPPALHPTIVCTFCPSSFTARTDLYTHFRLKHAQNAALICGTCQFVATSPQNLQTHIDACAFTPSTRLYCRICHYSDDNAKNLENHVLVHAFIIDACNKSSKMFDPADYIETNPNMAPIVKNLSCGECGADCFDNFKEFSAHRRSNHSIFHCDLCNKFYGRNSHLWKHVNRLHKGHPSITCQLCYKTSASKYHLGQHFNKIHSSKAMKSGGGVEKAQALNTIVEENGDFMAQKFQAFDFQSVKQSFLRQEMLDAKKSAELGRRETSTPNHDLDSNSNSDDEIKQLPKEIDTSSDLYTNIITNYTPPANEGEFKCPKCGKAFHKKTLLKKHKKNCRPRLQKDLLTRCKSCARIFKDRQSLAKHLVNYHSEYNCELCNQKVQSKCEIVSHIRFGHPNCHLFCPICGNILRSHLDLEQHKRDHWNSYVCQFCGDQLPSKIKLKMHILSLHRKILSLSCGVCLKLFETQHVLRDHVRLVHKDQLAPLTSCPVCGKNYGSKWKTYDHLTKSHGRIFKACKSCLEVFDTDAQLQKHVETAHGTGVQVQKGPFLGRITPQNGIEITEPEPVVSEDEDSCDDMKVSLLEKHLLANQQQQKVDKGKVMVVARKLEIGGDDNSSMNHSSKRTVYVNSTDPSFCEICYKTWPAKKHLWQHYIRCHKQVAATVCGICLKTNGDYKALQVHLRSEHPTLLHGQGFGSNFICRICGRYHNANSKLKLHMVIHENFDWSLLNEEFGKSEDLEKKEEDELDGDDDEEDDDDEEQTVQNGFIPDIIPIQTIELDEEEEEEEEEDEENEEINYESLIETVECSSGNEEEAPVKIESSSDDDSTDEENERGDEIDAKMEEENAIEREMLANMLKEKQLLLKKSETKTEDDDGDHFDDDDEEEEEGESDSPEERIIEVNDSSNSCYTVIKSEEDDDDEDDDDEEDEETGEFFAFKPVKTEELDSAIQSIKYEECVEEMEVGVVGEGGEFEWQGANVLNENEIESAVGSIL